MKFSPEILGPIDERLAHKAVLYLENADRRASMQGLPGARISKSDFARWTGLKFDAIARYLIEHGFLHKIRYRRRSRSYTLYSPTDLGRRLAASNPGKRLTRQQLDALWDTTWEKIQEVNREDRFIFEYKLVVIYGSFLVDQADYGDLDLALVIGMKDKFRGRSVSTLNRHHLRHFPGDRWQSGMPFWQGQRRAARYVKGRTRLEFHWVDDFLMTLARNPEMQWRVILGNLEDYRSKRVEIPPDKT